jgi:type II secretory pathway component GspD/PulD (secretin)
MKRLALLFVIGGILLPAGLALYAQDSGGSAEDQIDEVIKSLKTALKEATANAPARAVTFELRMYDVRALVTPICDYPGEESNLVPSGGFGFGFGDEESLEPMAYYEIDAISDMIRENVAPESWDELRSVSISDANGVLMIRHTPAVHARIAALLDQLRQKAASQVNLGVKVLSLEDRALRGILGGESAAVLSAAGEKRLAQAIREGRAKVVKSGSVACSNTQRVALSDTGQVSYVQDYDVEIAQGAFIPDPIILQLREGLTFDVRPIVAGLGDLLVLEVRVELSELTRPLESFETTVGEIETPVLEINRVHTTLAVPVGRSIVVGGSLADDDDDAVLFVVTPKVTRPGQR